MNDREIPDDGEELSGTGQGEGLNDEKKVPETGVVETPLPSFLFEKVKICVKETSEISETEEQEIFHIGLTPEENEKFIREVKLLYSKLREENKFFLRSPAREVIQNFSLEDKRSSCQLLIIIALSLYTKKTFEEGIFSEEFEKNLRNFLGKSENQSESKNDPILSFLKRNKIDLPESSLYLVWAEYYDFFVLLEKLKPLFFKPDIETFNLDQAYEELCQLLFGLCSSVLEKKEDCRGKEKLEEELTKFEIFLQKILPFYKAILNDFRDWNESFYNLLENSFLILKVFEKNGGRMRMRDFDIPEPLLKEKIKNAAGIDGPLIPFKTRAGEVLAQGGKISQEIISYAKKLGEEGRIELAICLIQDYLVMLNSAFATWLLFNEKGEIARFPVENVQISSGDRDWEKTEIEEKEVGFAYSLMKRRFEPDFFKNDLKKFFEREKQIFSRIKEMAEKQILPDSKLKIFFQLLGPYFIASHFSEIDRFFDPEYLKAVLEVPDGAEETVDSALSLPLDGWYFDQNEIVFGKIISPAFLKVLGELKETGLFEKYQKIFFPPDDLSIYTDPIKRDQFMFLMQMSNLEFISSLGVDGSFIFDFLNDPEKVSLITKGKEFDGKFKDLIKLYPNSLPILSSLSSQEFQEVISLCYQHFLFFKEKNRFPDLINFIQSEENRTKVLEIFKLRGDQNFSNLRPIYPAEINEKLIEKNLPGNIWEKENWLSLIASELPFLQGLSEYHLYQIENLCYPQTDSEQINLLWMIIKKFDLSPGDSILRRIKEVGSKLESYFQFLQWSLLRNGTRRELTEWVKTAGREIEKSKKKLVRKKLSDQFKGEQKNLAKRLERIRERKPSKIPQELEVAIIQKLKEGHLKLVEKALEYLEKGWRDFDYKTFFGIFTTDQNLEENGDLLEEFESGFGGKKKEPFEPMEDEKQAGREFQPNLQEILRKKKVLLIIPRKENRNNYREMLESLGAENILIKPSGTGRRKGALSEVDFEKADLIIVLGGNLIEAKQARDFSTEVKNSRDKPRGGKPFQNIPNIPRILITDSEWGPSRLKEEIIKKGKS